MTSLRFDDGSCAAMTPAKGEAFRASLTSFRHHAAQRRSHGVSSQKLERAAVSDAGNTGFLGSGRRREGAAHQARTNCAKPAGAFFSFSKLTIS